MTDDLLDEISESDELVGLDATADSGSTQSLADSSQVRSKLVHEREEQERKWKQRFDSLQQRFQDTQIYLIETVMLRNLDKSATEDDIKSVLASENAVGIVSVLIARTEAGESKGFAFLKFASKDEAARIVLALSRKMIKGSVVDAALLKTPIPDKAAFKSDCALSVDNMSVAAKVSCSPIDSPPNSILMLPTLDARTSLAKDCIYSV